VLFQKKNVPLELFYKVGPDPKRWWGMQITSKDAGRTWSQPVHLPGLGPIKDKPVELANGELFCPSSSEDKGWRVHFERRRTSGEWIAHPPINDGKEFGVIQPTILFHSTNRLQMICRSRQGRIVESWSDDWGWTWQPLKATALPNPNAGIDAVTLRDGRHLLVYNPVTKGRSPLSVAVSRDGKEWKEVVVLENQPGEYSYPAIIETGDGLAHITYTWKRQRIKHAILDPRKF
jgi:predicted neuraminidase